jgi:hypothetical protein
MSKVDEYELEKNIASKKALLNEDKNIKKLETKDKQILQKFNLI